MRERSGFLGILTCVLLVGGLLSHTASAAPPPKPPLTIAARLTVESPPSAGGLIFTSDGHGDYINGVDGVQCVFFNPDAGGSGDLVFDTDFNASPQHPASRGFYYQFVSQATGLTCQPYPGGSVPAAGVYTTSHLVVGGGYWRTLNGGYRVSTLPVGMTAFFGAWVRVSETTPLHFSEPSGPNGDCATPVRVTREDSATWTIEAFSTDVAAIYQTVTRKDGPVPTSYWTMPFRITVRLQ